MKKLISILNVAFIALLMAGCAQQAEQGGSTTEGTVDDSHPLGQASYSDDVSDKNILQIAAGSADHSTLVAAVQAAQIEHVLVNAGPLTVFAPTNAAFEKLPAGTVEELLKPENKAKLANILTYHAAPGTYQGESLPRIMGIGQATGAKVKIEEKDGAYTVNGANILATIKASNGVVHVIDGVLLPPEE
jgi:uncharacterized surface protein with fasciclin (FAS1) repeats